MEHYLMYSIFFITGINLGVLVMFMMTSKRASDLNDEITHLRAVRDLLKKELVKKDKLKSVYM